MKKINIAFSSFPDYSSNTKNLYLYMKKKYKNTMNLVWIIRNERLYIKLSKKGIKTYLYGTEPYYDYIKKTDIIFTTHADLIDDKPMKGLYVELWHGLSSKQIGYLSENMNEYDVDWYKIRKRKLDYIIVPSDFWRVIFSTRFNINYKRVLSLGYPKLDSFIQKGAKQKLEKILNEDLQKYKKIIYYMPTFRNGCNRMTESNINNDNILNLKKYNEDILHKYLKDNEYLLCIKKHPSEEKKINIKSETENIKIIDDEVLLTKEITINEILDAADLMITDYSSLGIEFSFLDKPIIYLVNDIKEYMINRGITFNNLNFWMPGYKVKDIDKLIFSIEKSLSANNPFKNELKEKKRLWFGKLKNGGCENICNFFFNNGKINSKVKYYIDYEETLENKNEELHNRISEQNILIKDKINYIKKLDTEIEEKVKLIKKNQQEIKQKNEKIMFLENETKNKKYEIELLQQELNSIINSKGWRLLEKLRKLKYKLIRK